MDSRECCSGAWNGKGWQGILFPTWDSGGQLGTGGNSVPEQGTAKDSTEHCAKLWTAGKTVPELGTVQDSSEQEGTVFRSRVQKKQKGALCISYEQQQTLLQGLGQLRTARDRR